jgi:hypothetical protein
MLRLLIPLALVSAAACAAASEPMPEAAAPELSAAALVEQLEAAPAPAEPAQQAVYLASGVECEIYRARTLHGLRLEAMAIGFEASPEPLDYEFIVTKQGPGGSSDIMQAGEVSEGGLGSVDLSLERGDRFHATLTLSDSEGEVCAAELSS